MKKLVLLTLALILTLVLAACTEENTTSDESEEETVTPVEVDEVTKDDLVVEKEFYGRSMPNASTPVIPQVPGEVEELEVAKGDQVEEGDVIATIERADRRGTLEIEAPADGEVTTLNAKEGNMVSNSEPMAMITDLAEVQIQVNITADNLALFSKLEEVLAEFSAINMEKTATVDYVSSVANEMGLFTVELTVENDSDHSMKPGMVAVLHLPEQVVENALIIPTTALVEEDNQTFVYIVEENKAVKKEITVLQSQTDVTAIEGDVTEGATVVTSGQLTLTDGSKVEIMKEEQ